MVNWIKDVDTGELFPIPDNLDFEIPAHLELSEYTPVDYEKTTKMTIDELQNQLLAAQNQIEEMQKTESDTSSTEIIQYQGRLNADEIFNKGKSRSFNFDIVFHSFIIIVLIIVAIFMLVSNIESDVFDTPTAEISEQQLVEQQDQEQYQLQEQNYKSDKWHLQYYIDKYSDSPLGFVFKIVPVLLTVLGIRLSIRFMISTIRGS